ncbi:patatin-like phospholipase family protein [Streptomyces ipomoeae]|uniref:patatin-like phospholipase family protein n=1 Tax=Streptomyces ipomoeae TaxID=103232 RepID=UPI0015F0FE55|nr:patatin-like phospholipase family protein [Streptomyces ipomoeae]
MKADAANAGDTGIVAGDTEIVAETVRPRKRSLLLAGGGVKVAFQAGVLQVWLDEAGLRFDHADGASGGTFNLAMLCQGMSGTEIADAWRRTSPASGVSPNWRQFTRPGYLQSLFTLDAYRRTVFPGWGLDFDRVRSSALEATFNVYNVTRQRLQVLPPKRMSEDFLAACVSLPMWFPPMRIDGETYMDPVYVTDANVEEAIDRGADEIWVIWTVSERGEWHRGFTAAYFQIIEAAANGAFRRIQDRIERNNADIAAGGAGEFGRRIEVNVLAAEVPLHYLVGFGADRLHEAVNRGVLAARAWCAERKIPLAEPAPWPAPADPLSLRFTERLSGTVAPSAADGGALSAPGGAPLSLGLDVSVDDLDRFLTDPEHTASVSGRLSSTAFGGDRPLTGGTLQMLVDDDGDPARKEIRYLLYFTNERQAPLTLIGSRRLTSGDPLRIWDETTVLRARVVRGHRTPADAGDVREPDGVVAEAVLRLGPLALLRQLAGLRISGSPPVARAAGLARLGAMVFGKLWDVYARPVLTWGPV